MIEWRLESSTLIDHWNVAEYDARGVFLGYIVRDQNKVTAGRIAKLPELEARLAEADELINELYDGSDSDAWDKTAAYWNKYFPDAPKEAGP